jgi:hypothetical protein
MAGFDANLLVASSHPGSPISGAQVAPISTKSTEFNIYFLLRHTRRYGLPPPDIAHIWTLHLDRLFSVTFCKYLSFIVVFPFYPPYYTGSLRFVRELSFDAFFWGICMCALPRDLSIGQPHPLCLGGVRVLLAG